MCSSQCIDVRVLRIQDMYYTLACQCPPDALVRQCRGQARPNPNENRLPATPEAVFENLKDARPPTSCDTRPVAVLPSLVAPGPDPCCHSRIVRRITPVSPTGVSTNSTAIAVTEHAHQRPAVRHSPHWRPTPGGAGARVPAGEARHCCAQPAHWTTLRLQTIDHVF